MGLNDVGTALSHEDTMKWAPYVREHGITQFINLYRRHKNRTNDPLKWGDEIEYTLVKFDQIKKKVKLSLTSHQILRDINDEIQTNGLKTDGFWAPEYGAFMIEGTPAAPYEGLNFSQVEDNMRKRRKELKKFLKHSEDLVCVTSFPRLGCKNFTYPDTKVTPNKGLTKSLFFPDGAIFPGHPRYKNTTKNIMGRRGGKAYYNIPIFKDKNTKFPVDDSSKKEKNALSDHIYIDAMGFGSGYSCLQVTFQGSNIDEARFLYDQLAPFCPIMMALAAAAPFHRGFITDVDTRWKILCNTHDCRTDEERGLKPLRKNKFRISKSRYGSIDCYISKKGEIYNDNPVLYYEEDYQRLIENGVDVLLAKHIAHLFVRDTISMFEEHIYQDDETESGHFESIQSTNWQSLRFKPPPPNAAIGWRVEFRPCDLQITDFENAAIVCFLILLTRITLSYKLNFLIPMSKVDENIEKAQTRNAATEQKYWFRKDIFQNDENKTSNGTRNQFMKVKIGDKNVRIFNELNGRKNSYNEEICSDYYVFNGNDNGKHISYEANNDFNGNIVKTKNIYYNGNNLNGNNYIFNHKYKGINGHVKNSVNGYSSENNSLPSNGSESEINNKNIKKKHKICVDINSNVVNEKYDVSEHHTNDNGFINGNRKFSDHENDKLKSIDKEKLINKKNINEEWCQMTINEIINGKKGEFPGVIPLMHKYLDGLNLKNENRFKAQEYLRLIGERASGKLLTTAAWMRKFVTGHSDYRHDSVITEEINYDLLKTMQKIQNGELHCPELLGK